MVHPPQIDQQKNHLGSSPRQYKFSSLSTAKVKEGVFIDNKIENSHMLSNFSISWKGFKANYESLLDDHRSTNYRVLVQHPGRKMVKFYIHTHRFDSHLHMQYFPQFPTGIYSKL
jgi:hypothetical protein